MLEKFKIFKIKALDFERKTMQEKKDMAKQGELTLSFQVEAQKIEQERPATVESYLEALAMFLFAMAIIGSKELTNQPSNDAGPIPEDDTTDPCNYVQFPYQLALDHHERAQRCARALPASVAFAQLVARDPETNKVAARLYTLTSPNSIHILWQFPQYFVITSSEVMFSVTGWTNVNA